MIEIVSKINELTLIKKYDYSKFPDGFCEVEIIEEENEDQSSIYENITPNNNKKKKKNKTQQKYFNPTNNKYVGYTRAKMLGLI
jgi:hypothetical protein